MTGARVFVSAIAACGATATAAFPQSYNDAEIVALELSGQLLAPPAVVTQVEADFAAIRAAHPHLESIHARPSWIPGRITVGLTPEAMQEFLAGQYDGLDSLNAVYGPVTVCLVLPSIDFIVLCFDAPYHSVLLAEIYADAEGVRSAGPDVLMGDSDDIFSTVLGTYTFKQGWGDCPAGCTREHFWVLQVVSGVVTLLEDYGDPVPGVTGVGSGIEDATFSRIKVKYRSP